MSGVLLDTHIFQWHATSDPRLPATYVSRIGSESGPVFLSVVSAWEIAIKVGLGKLQVVRPLDDLIGDSLISRGIELLPIAPDDVRAYVKLPFPESGHRDPFDRMLATQAQVRDLTILTMDQAFASYAVRRFMQR